MLFASTGEKLGDFERFHADRMASRILDMGDVMTLIEQAEKAFDEGEAEKMAEKLGQGAFTLDDFLSQLGQLRRMGSMKKMLGMLPGMGQLRDELDNFDEREVDRIEAIVRSMTPAERANVKILNGSRRSRIARGSGTTVAEINAFVERYLQAKTMMESMARSGGGMGGPGGMGGLGGMPGMGNMPGMGKKARGRQAPAKKRPKGKSGNPAKRARQEAEMERKARQRAEEASKPKPKGSSFGLGSLGSAAGADQSFEVPEGLEKFLKK